MERNKAGKKRRIYPKRSEIIKIYPVINLPPKVTEKQVPFKISNKEVGYKEVRPEYEHVSIDLDDLNPKLFCTNCPLKFDNKSELDRHEMLKHSRRQKSENSKSFIESPNDQGDSKKKQLKNMNTFNCSKCFREFQKEKSLNQHVSFMHSENIFQCTFCQLEFKLESVMKKHQIKCTNGSEIMKIYPVVNSHPKISDKKVPCTKTLNEFLTKKEMKKDTIGSKSRQYPETSEIIKIDPGIDLPPKIPDNEVATEIFDKDALLEVSDKKVPPEIYDNEVKGETTYTCGYCSKVFKSKIGLKIHGRTHNGEKQYSCKTCNKSFNKLGNMKRHELIHTGEQPYSCKICKKSFNQAGNAKRHELIHTGRKK